MVAFDNLAGGHKGPMYSAKELVLAGIPFIDGPIYGETKSSVIGTLDGWVFTRAWYYWIAQTSGKTLAYTAANRLNVDWGDQVRAYGFGGGTSLAAKLPESYHIDTQEGLSALAAAIRSSKDGVI